MKAAKLNIDMGIPAPKEVYNWRVYMLALVASMGAVMFGYDLGFIGTALELESFQKDFGTLHASTSEKSAFAANVVSLLQAGCIVGSLAISPVSDKWGRRFALLMTALFYNVGSAIQTGAHGSTALMLAGRAIGGVGVGAASMIVPLYIAEAAPPHIRGTLVGVYEVGVSAGTMIGFWINYGLSINLPATSTQWIISFAVQLIPGGLLMVGLIFLPESPRWLARAKGREACVSVLENIRNIPRDHPFLLEEVHGIFSQLDHELETDSGHGFIDTLREMGKPGNRKRLLSGSLMFIFMQMAGSNAINYYSPAIFKSLGLTGTNVSFFATGIYGLIRFVAILIAMLWVVDRFGRTRTLMCGSAVMAFAMWFIGAYVKVATPGAQINSGGYAAVAMIYIYAIGWCFSWAGIPWIYASEIFPLRIRSSCVAVCVAIHWIMNFVIARSVPYMITNISYGTYFLFAAFMTIAIPWVWFFVPETKGLSLEDVDQLFGVPTEPHLFTESKAAEAGAGGSATQVEDAGQKV
ncbi:general substrate transporter [Microdochium trichocladiopsis]|uniref:Quinate transporter n=1 Tax=Microdochium trichocladiopsis TaxID=1682393 RepID=A0A9P9BPD3_9PEZI|nr:general substrate transporter [Microdochium trichocladiopsis]KAH7028960.1 general substrate transporter [Microdochium trichocladiopsis]